MPWFCHGKKRSNKTRVSSVGKVNKEDDTLTNGRPMFAVVLRDFSAVAADELNVRRGQMVEAVYVDGDWINVRNMDGSSGYIPKNFCLDLKKMKGDFVNTSTNHPMGPIPPPRTINLDTLQRSGSSVNSVEIHHVVSNTAEGTTGTDGPNPDDVPNSPTSLSQAIYEVPRSPVLANSNNLPQPMSSGGRRDNPPMTVAPSLPPRSSNLPSPANLQQNCIGTSPGLSYGCSNRYRPGFLTHLQGSNRVAQTPGSNRSPITPETHLQNHPHRVQTPISNHVPGLVHTPGSYNPHTPPNDPLNIGHTTTNSFNLTHSSQFSSTRNSCPPLRGAQARGVLRHHQNLKRPNTTDLSLNVAHTPGSAGTPAIAASPTSARVALTPGSPTLSLGLAVTPGYATKPRLATTPGAVGVIDSNFGVAVDSTSPYSQRSSQRSRKNRRHSSDIILLQSTISENVNNMGNIGPRSAPPLHYARRQSQPMLDLQLSSQQPRHRPFRRSLSMHDHCTVYRPAPGASCENHESPLSSVPLHRADSYREAVLTEDEKVFGLTAGIKPSELVNKKTLAAVAPIRQVRNQPRSARYQTGCDHDDVFLPDSKKPIGIYRCIQAYRPKFKGEIGLKENELVIMLDYGRGEWAWVVTSANIEGLIPKSNLVQYHSGSEVERCRNGNRVDVATQTDLNQVPFCQDASALISAESNSSIRMSTGSPYSTVNPRKKKNTSLAASAEATFSTQSRPKEWFDTLDSVDERERFRSANSAVSAVHEKKTASSSLPLPKTNRKDSSSQASKQSSLVDGKRWAISLPQTPLLDNGLVLVSAGTAPYHDRISGLGPVNFNRNSLSQQNHYSRIKSSTLLTAVKDYSPPANARNCIPLTKGDILHSQPHMHYPKGWMWVWHTTRKSFGYVPKSYVAYTYATPPRERQRTDSVEDAV